MHRSSIRALVALLSLVALGAPAGARAGQMAVQTAWTGAPTWWAAGDTGQNAGLYIDSDPLDISHPFFASSHIEVPGTLVNNGAGHGTEVAGMAASAGNGTCGPPGNCTPGDANEQGVAPGIGALLEINDGTVPSGFFAPDAWALGVTQTDPNGSGHVLPGASFPASVFSTSGGTAATQDDNEELQDQDALIAGYNINWAYSAGNDGPTGVVSDPCEGYDTVCVGGIDTYNATDHSADQIASFSSRGPTPGGREKPDVVALADVESTCFDWGSPACGGSSPYLEVHDTGTSFAAPQVAGGLALLASSGISSALERKALLIDSARPGRDIPSDPMGTQTAWQPDWGWGELDLTDAYTQRANLATASIPAASVQFYRASTTATGDRATLVWNRRVDNPCFPLDYQCAPAPHALTQLSLYELDQGTLAVRSSSTSAIDNVQQVRSPGADSVYYMVKSQSAPLDGVRAEPFAIAATNPLSTLITPTPGVTLNTSAAAVNQDIPVTVTATITNPSPDLDLGSAGEHATVTLAVPVGVSITAGPATQDLGVLAHCTNPSCPTTTTATWTVQGSSDQIAALTASVNGTVLGQTLTGSASASLTIDNAPPSVSISSPSGSQTATAIPVSWSGQGQQELAINGFDIQASVDGGAFAPWQTNTTATSATYTGSPGHSYRFEVRARDTLGNQSAYTQSNSVTIADVCANDAALCAPAVEITAPSGTVTQRLIPVSWAAQPQPGFRIAGYDAEVSADGGPFTAWVTNNIATGSSYQGSPGHSYRFEVRARDQAGHVSAWALSATVTVADVCADDSAKCPARASARLRVTRAKLAPASLLLAGTLTRSATGPLRLVVIFTSTTGHHQSVTVKVHEAARGSFAIRIHAAKRLRRLRSARYTLTYPGSPTIRPARLTGTVRLR